MSSQDNKQKNASDIIINKLEEHVKKFDETDKRINEKLNELTKIISEFKAIVISQHAEQISKINSVIITKEEKKSTTKSTTKSTADKPEETKSIKAPTTLKLWFKEFPNKDKIYELVRSCGATDNMIKEIEDELDNFNKNTKDVNDAKRFMHIANYIGEQSKKNTSGYVSLKTKLGDKLKDHKSSIKNETVQSASKSDTKS